MKKKQVSVNETKNETDIDKNIIAPYLEKFNTIQNQQHVRNIALMGPYGSGKSTILKELKNQDSKKYINVSMMEFSDEVELNNKDIDTKNDHKDIDTKKDKREKVEQSIIQQLIYQVPQKKIPQSKIKKEYPTQLNIFTNISIFVVLIIAIILFSSFHLQNFTNVLSWIVFSIILSSGIYLLFRIIYYIHKNYRISKISAKIIADIECNKYESVYNNFLDELVYFFKCTSYDTVIFEDIDRYNDIVFFSHLRELNTLLNNSQYLDKKITFIYAVKEEPFVKQDKHKFFDEIMQVVPIVDYTNSFNSFKKFIQDTEIEDKTLKILAAYVYDLRTIKNIAKEYNFFSALSNITIYNKNSLLAILVFKNLYPQEFEKLQYNESIIDTLFASKENEIEKIKESKKIEIVHLTKALKDKEYCIDPKYSLLGLIKDYLQNIVPINKYRIIHGIWIAGVNGKISIAQIMDAQINWNEIKNIENIKIEHTYGLEDIVVSDYLKEQIKELAALQKSKEKVQLKTKKQIETKIDKLNFEMSTYTNIKASTLYYEKQDVLKNILEQYQESNKSILNKKFIPFVTTLILEDLINESYSNYISLNNGINSNENEQLFIQNEYANIKNTFDLKLLNIDIIYNELKDRLYKSQNTFNYDIILFLAKNNKYNLENLLQVNKERLDLLYKNLDCNYKDFSIIASSMLKVNSELVVDLLSKEIDKYKCDIWLRELLCLPNIILKDIKIGKVFEKIKNYDLIYLSKITTNEINNLISNLQEKNICFINISGCQQNEILFDRIKRNKLFAINFENLHIIDTALNYDKLLEMEGVGEYVQSHIKEFVKILVDKQITTRQSQDFHTFINSNIKDENLLAQYYTLNLVKIENIKSIKSDKVRIILSKDVMHGMEC